MMQLRLVQQLVYRPHSAMDNPEITSEACEINHEQKRIFSSMSNLYVIMQHVEAWLLEYWKSSSTWERYLDAPLFCHADAALQLKSHYDAVVAIRSAGEPYAEIFKLMGLPVYAIDFSHHKRSMSAPEIDETSIKYLKKFKSVLLIDIDFVTGRTINTVAGFLMGNGVAVNGVYIGLTRWPGMDLSLSCINVDTIDFDNFWVRNNTGLAKLGSMAPYNMGIVLPWLKIYSVNPDLEHDSDEGSRAALRVAKVLRKWENQ